LGLKVTAFGIFGLDWGLGRIRGWWIQVKLTNCGIRVIIFLKLFRSEIIQSIGGG